MRAVDDLERAEQLDGLVGLGQRWARLLRPGRFRDALYGVWLGHPLHPMLAQAPIGLWLSATVLDAWPGDERASRRLVLLGLAASAPAALAGAADWSEQHEQQMRVGAVHAMTNGAAIGLYAASLAARTRPASRMRAGPGWPRPGRPGCWAGTSRSGWRAVPTSPSSGDPEWRNWAAQPVRPAQRRVVGGQDLPDLLGPPGAVPRFHGNPQPAVAGDRGAPELGEAGVQQGRLRLERRRQLQQDGAELGAERRGGIEKPGDRLARVAQLPDMGEVPACLHRHDEIVRGANVPAREGAGRGQPIEGVVVLHHQVVRGMVPQPAALRHARRVEPAPVAVLPAGGADQYGHALASLPPGRPWRHRPAAPGLACGHWCPGGRDPNGQHPAALAHTFAGEWDVITGAA
jgi:hypothetical protein